MKTTAKVEVCPHGRAANGGCWWRGIPPCEDCDREDWLLARKTTVFGVALITALIMLPAVLILAGTFW